MAKKKNKKTNITNCNIKPKKYKCEECGISFMKVYNINISLCVNCGKRRNILIPASNIRFNDSYAKCFRQKNSLPDVKMDLFCSKTYVFFIDDYLRKTFYDEYTRVEGLLEDIYGYSVEFLYEYSPLVTHHIVFDKNRVCKLSPEYLFSLVGGKYILTMDFLTEMVVKIPNEQDFLINGDTRNSKSMAPHKCLKKSQYAFFTRLNFLGKDRIFDKKTLKVLETCGSLHNVKSERQLNRAIYKPCEFKDLININVKSKRAIFDFFCRWEFD
ncbi:hypothetical protein CDIK_1895 [Cucumispora dikerogammari]|nr:hypothetical protein CDIK_1895 [Cucumispora dikerogammari]